MGKTPNNTFKWMIQLLIWALRGFFRSKATMKVFRIKN